MWEETAPVLLPLLILDKAGKHAADAPCRLRSSGAVPGAVSSHMLDPDKDAQVSFTGLISRRTARGYIFPT